MRACRNFQYKIKDVAMLDFLNGMFWKNQIRRFNLCAKFRFGVSNVSQV